MHDAGRSKWVAQKGGQTPTCAKGFLIFNLRGPNVVRNAASGVDGATPFHPFRAAPRTEPGVQISRTGLAPWVNGEQSDRWASSWPSALEESVGARCDKVFEARSPGPLIRPRTLRPVLRKDWAFRGRTPPGVGLAQDFGVQSSNSPTFSCRFAPARLPALPAFL